MSPSSRTRRRRKARSNISTSSRSRTRLARFKRIAGERRVPGIVHDRGLARHHLVHHAQRLLREPRRLSRRAGARDAQGISGDPQGRADAADRCARSRDGPHHVSPRSVGQRIRQGSARSRSPRSTGRSRAFRATACGCMSATATGKARISTTSPLEKILPALYTAKVGALSIEFSNPRHAHEYAALKTASAADAHAAASRRDRDHLEFRRASGSGGAADRGRGRGRSATASA